MLRERGINLIIGAASTWVTWLGMEPKKSVRKGTIFHSGCFGFDTLRFTYIHCDIGLIIVITLDEDKSKQIISGNFPGASGGHWWE